MQPGFRRAALTAALGVFAGGLGVLPAAAADVAITDAKVVGGKLVVTGTTQTANMQIELDGGAFTGKSNGQKTFTFAVVYLPTDCIVEVNKVGAVQTAKAVVADCGPAGVQPMGPWKATTKYLENDLVTWQGSSWRAKTTSTNRTPSTSGGYWEQFVARGGPGEIGPAGPTGPIGLTGASGATGTNGSEGPQGTAGPQGPVGATGPQGPQGLQGISGVVGSFYSRGEIPSLADTGGYSFFGTNYATANINGDQTIIVEATATLGSTAVGGATLERLSICKRVSGSTTLVDNGADYASGLSVPQNSRLPFSLSTRFSGLPAGAYDVGICYLTLFGQAATWNNNDWVRTMVLIAKQ
jgi:hypothetical protein